MMRPLHRDRGLTAAARHMVRLMRQFPPTPSVSAEPPKEPAPETQREGLPHVAPYAAESTSGQVAGRPSRDAAAASHAS